MFLVFLFVFYVLFCLFLCVCVFVVYVWVRLAAGDLGYGWAIVTEFSRER